MSKTVNVGGGSKKAGLLRCVKLRNHQFNNRQIDRQIDDRQIAIYKPSGNHKPKIYNRHRHKKRERNKNITRQSLNHQKREQKKKGTKRTTKQPQNN